MERASIYRRALAPVMHLLGVLGLAAGAMGWYWRIDSGRGFALYWMTVSLLGVCGAYWLVRRQALKEDEPFWSLPTQRITQALLPPLFGGMMAGFYVIFPARAATAIVWWLPALWMILYGSALHAAGFFTPRGVKLFGWIFILSGSLLGWAVANDGGTRSLAYAHAAMGTFFGGLHLAYGVYLNFTEGRRHEL